MASQDHSKRRIAALAALAAAILLQSCAGRPIVVKTPDFASLPDGTYRGSCSAGLVEAIVDVVMVGGSIQKVMIVSHRCGKGKPAEAVAGEVVKRQSLEVDAVSGATRSSKVILKAIESALTRQPAQGG